MLDGLNISFGLYLILVLAAFIIIFIFGLYIFSQYHFGKSMAMFFWGRLKSWTDNNITIFQILTLNNIVSMEWGAREPGGGFRRLKHVVKESSKLKDKLKEKLNPINPSQSDRKNELILPKSTYTINGVTTLMLWDLHPTLHPDVIKGVETLLSGGVTTLEELIEKTKEHPNDLLFSGVDISNKYTYKRFLELYLATIQKYQINVTVNDINTVISSNFNKSFRATIIANNYNMKVKRKIENKYLLYGYIALIIVAVGLTVKVIYLTFWPK